jgi:hypothetical protein
MPLYFFDIQDGDRRVRDNEGTELPDVQAAMNETQAALADTAKDKLPDGDRRDFIITVREGDRKLFTATLSLRVEWEA